MWPIWVDLDSWRWQMSLESFSEVLKIPHFSHKIIWIAPHPPLEGSRWSFVMSRLTQTHHCLGKWLADLIEHKDAPPEEGYIWRSQGFWIRPLSVFKMMKVAGKPQGSTAVMEQLTSYIQEENMKTSWQLWSKGSAKVSWIHLCSYVFLGLTEYYHLLVHPCWKSSIVSFFLIADIPLFA